MDFPSAQDARSLGAALPGAMLSALARPPIVPRRTMATLFGREGELMKGVFLRMLEGFVAPACVR